METVNFKRELTASFSDAIARTEAALKSGGFGVLTRIDFDTKIKEKLGKDLSRTVILGACNPQLAYEAFTLNSDVTSLLPCNVVVRELSSNRVSIEVAKPTAMMKMLGDAQLINLAAGADATLLKILESI